MKIGGLRGVSLASAVRAAMVGRNLEETTMSEQPVGEVTHYFNKAEVAGITIIEGELKIGDTISVIGQTTDFQQDIESMQIEHESVETATIGDRVGIRVTDRVRVHDKVFRVSAA